MPFLLSVLIIFLRILLREKYKTLLPEPFSGTKNYYQVKFLDKTRRMVMVILFGEVEELLDL